MAQPVLRRIRETMPQVQLAYTFFSPSAERFAASADVDFCAYLPFDRDAAMRRAVEALRPTALVFSKLDVWPRLVAQARMHGVALGMISATLASDSSRRGIGGVLTREAYAALDIVGAVSDEDAARLIAAGVHRSHLRVTGDTRYDQAWGRAHGQKPNAELVESLTRRDRFTLVAGSTWPADETVLLAGWDRMVREAKDAHHNSPVPAAIGADSDTTSSTDERTCGTFRLIIAPHETTTPHLTAIERWAAAAGYMLRRLDAPDAAHADVILVDRVGVLADLYAVAGCGVCWRRVSSRRTAFGGRARGAACAGDRWSDASWIT